jgi:hypothetical protein
MKRTALWAAAVLCAAPVGAQDPSSSDARLRELERQNREILDRLQASEARNTELETKLSTLAEARLAEKTDAAVETEVNAVTRRLQDGVNWKQLTRSGYPLKFYGFFRTDAQYSSARFNDNVNIQWVLREGDGTGGTVMEDDDEFDFDLRLTRFGFDVNGGKIGQADVTGKLEMDFANTPLKSVSVQSTGSPVTSISTISSSLNDESRHTPRIRHAWMQADFGAIAMRIGQDWDVIAPLMPSVNQDTLMWNAGNLGDRRPMAQFIWDGGDPKGSSFQLKIAAGLSGAVAAADADRNGQNDGWDTGHPHLQTRFGFSTCSWVEGKMLALGAWAYVARMEVDSASTIPNFAGDTHFNSNAVGVDFSVPLFDTFSLKGEAFFGQALADVRGSIGQYFGTTDEVDTWGGWVELEWKLDAFTAVIGASIDNPDNGDVSTSATSPGRSKNWTLWLGTKYDFGGGFKVGADIIYWETQYGSVGQGEAVRLDIYTVFEF